MKATGIVRRIDDLGRVVIPKEIRRTMRIREGEPLEIFTDAGGSVIFRKYSPAGELSSLAESLCESLYKTTSRPFVICDRDSVIAASGPLRKELDGRPLSNELEAAMSSRQLKREVSIPISPNVQGSEACLTAPIISGGDLCGCVAILGKETPLGESDLKLAQAASLFFAKQMED